MDITEILEGSSGRVARTTVVFDDQCVTCTRPSGLIETVTWEKLQTVLLLTTEDGPAACDSFWVLEGGDSGCVVPSDAVGMDRLLVRLQQLPAFQNDAVISAMGCTENRQWLCWQRQ